MWRDLTVGRFSEFPRRTNSFGDFLPNTRRGELKKSQGELDEGTRTPDLLHAN